MQRTGSSKQWHRNLYWTWLDALKPLLGRFPEGYPTFMRTEAWRDKELEACLGSWTELGRASPWVVPGGLVIGILQNLAGAYLDRYFPGGVKEVFPFAFMAVFLLFKPYGLWGWERIERV